MALGIRRVGGAEITLPTILDLMKKVREERNEEILSKEGYEEVVRIINSSSEMGSVYKVVDE